MQETSGMASQALTFKSILNSLALPTLEEISIMALSIELLQEEDVKKIYQQHFSAKGLSFSLTHNKISKLTSICKSLKIPDVLKSKLMSAFHWIANEYYIWIKFVVLHVPELERTFYKKRDFITHIMNSVKWSKGLIDKEKSLHQVFLINNRKYDHVLQEMFRTASRFCLEDDLKILWEEMSDNGKSTVDLNVYNEVRFFTRYWTCKMKGDMASFKESIPWYLKQQDYSEAVKGERDFYFYALVHHTFEGKISGMKYFDQLANVDIEDMVHIIKIYLKKMYFRPNYQQAEKLFFLLRKIEDEGILSELFHKFSRVFLSISIRHWPWQKFFLTFLRIGSDGISEVLVFDLIFQLLKDINIEKADMFQMKMLWKNLPIEGKKSFCSYISNKQTVIRIKDFWKMVTIEVFDMFLQDEEVRNNLSPYENYGILECIYSGRNDLIELWLQKCLESEEAIILYLENFIETKFVRVMKSLQRYPLYRVTQFLDWAFKYEDLMNRDSIFKIKDQVINQDVIAMFIRGLKAKKMEDIKKLIDWMVRNREHEYENELVNWKKKAVREFFWRPNLESIRNELKKSLLPFFSYGVNDPEKIKVMMSEVNSFIKNEGKIW